MSISTPSTVASSQISQSSIPLPKPIYKATVRRNTPAPRSFKPQLKPGQVVAFSLSCAGLSELFMDNPAVTGALRKLRYKKFLAVVHESTLYDPLGLIADGMYNFSRPPPEEVVLSFIQEKPGPKDSRVLIPSSSTWSPSFPHAFTNTGIKLITHHIKYSEDAQHQWTLDIKSREFAALQNSVVLQDLVPPEAGSSSPPRDIGDSTSSDDGPLLQEISAFADFGLLIDVWTDVGDVCYALSFEEFERETTAVRGAIARCYDPPTVDVSAWVQEQRDITPSAAAPTLGLSSLVGLAGVAVTAGMLWTSYLRRI